MKDRHNNYEVYEVCYKGRCVYIGSGEKNRHLHALSGKSSSVKLNELYFTDRDNITVLVLRENLSKEEAYELEKDFITANEPEFNIQHNNSKKKIKKFRKYTY